MSKEERDILEHLINIYEKSKSFRENTNTTNRILSTFYGKGNGRFSKYIIEDFELKTAYNKACITLREESLIDFDWLRGNTNNIIEKVWLNKENIQLAYKKINRVPKADYVLSVITMLNEYSLKLKSGWILNCITEWKKSIETKRTVGNFLPSDIKQIREYLNVIVGVYNINGIEILERVFSQNVLGKSKAFEKTYRSRLISMIKKNIDSDIDFNKISDREVLELVGIVKYPEQISFCGDLSLVSINDGEIINFKTMTNGAYINAKDVDMFNFKIEKSVKRIITIENMANYYDYLATKKNNDEIVIFHGGCYSPSKGKFFKKITTCSNSQTEFYHWGDIDFGGFSMLKRLRIDINDKYQALLMDKQDLIKHELLASEFDSSYAEKLKTLLQCNIIKDCHSCIEYMLDKNIRLEQESMIIYKKTNHTKI